METNLTESLKAHVATKADYLPVTLDDARQDFIERAEATATALRANEVQPYKPAPMAKQQVKTRLFCVKIGYGDNNAYLPNSIHAASQVLKYETAEEAAEDIENILIPLAASGGLDEALASKLEQHKQLAAERQAARKAS